MKELRELVQKIMQDWFNEERGNRVTSNNVQGLATKVGLAFDQHAKRQEMGDAHGGNRVLRGESGVLPPEQQEDSPGEELQT